MASKLYMKTAYDRLQWKFIHKCLTDFAFFGEIDKLDHAMYYNH